METDELKILVALEPLWTVSVNDTEFLSLSSSEIQLEGVHIKLGCVSRRITDIEWLRPNIVRIRARPMFRTRSDALILYPGQRLPPLANLRRRRRTFQNEIGRALCAYFGTRSIQKQMLHSDRRHAIGGAYPRFLIGNNAVISVDPDETSAVINAIMRAALLWKPQVRRHVTVVVPHGRHQTIASRLRLMPNLLDAFRWLEWDSTSIRPLSDETADPETYVQEYHDEPSLGPEVGRILSLAPHLLQAIPHIATKGISLRLRGIEVARVTEGVTHYPLGQPLETVLRNLDTARRHGSRHPLARTHEESWLESNLVDNIRLVLPSINRRHIYPQVPSFVGEERNIIDLLTVTDQGRLAVIEIKASEDPDLPFQALDYWIAVERHRKAGDFQRNGYFRGCVLRDEPAILVLVAPLLAFHRTSRKLLSVFPRNIPLLEIGINQSWKKEIKILRRRGLVS